MADKLDSEPTRVQGKVKYLKSESKSDIPSSLQC